LIREVLGAFDEPVEKMDGDRVRQAQAAEVQDADLEGLSLELEAKNWELSTDLRLVRGHREEYGDMLRGMAEGFGCAIDDVPDQIEKLRTESGDWFTVFKQICEELGLGDTAVVFQVVGKIQALRGAEETFKEEREESERRRRLIIKHKGEVVTQGAFNALVDAYDRTREQVSVKLDALLKGQANLLKGQMNLLQTQLSLLGEYKPAAEVMGGLYPFWEGCVVAATGRITEGGAGFPGSDEAKFPKPNYLHARVGDIGVVEGVDKDLPTVRFFISGTATIVGKEEVIFAAPTLDIYNLQADAMAKSMGIVNGAKPLSFEEPDGET